MAHMIPRGRRSNAAQLDRINETKLIVANDRPFERNHMLRKEKEREKEPVIFSVLVCLPAGMWALSLRPPRRGGDAKGRTHARYAVRNTANSETGEPVIKETVAAVPGQLSSDSKRTRAGFDPRRGEPLISHEWVPIKVAPRWIFTVVGSKIGCAAVGSGLSEDLMGNV